MKNSMGLIHIYCGNGKGKTTAATGLAVRALGAGMQVLFVQFMKDGSSSETGLLRSLPGLRFVAADKKRFSFAMNEEERKELRRCHDRMLSEVIELCSGGDFGLLVLDEAVGALDRDLLDRERLHWFLREKPKDLEVVLTGRNPAPELLELAGYISEIVCRRHPMEQKVRARKGIEK